MKLPYRLHDLNSLISEYAPTSPPHHRTQQTQPSTLYHCTITQRNPPLYTTSPYIYYSTNTCVPQAQYYKACQPMPPQYAPTSPPHHRTQQT